MGRRNTDLTADDACAVSSSSSSSSLSEALLFATMCIIGLPVDVHVRDGSVYSGIFHTASIENEYGIVLKKARMTKKGKADANVANGTLIDTLVILSGDLVQVVARGVLLPADGVAGNMSSDRSEAVMGTVSSDDCLKNEVKKSTESSIKKKKGARGLMQNGNGFAHGVTSAKVKAGKGRDGRKLPLKHVRNDLEHQQGKSDEVSISEIKESCATVHRRQIGNEMSQEKQDDVKQKVEVHREESDTKTTSKLLPSGVSCGPATTIIERENQCYERTTSEYTSSRLNVVSSGASTLLNPAADVSTCSSVTVSTEMIPPHGSESNKSGKEFKLNPGAKIFSPSFTKPIATTNPAVPTVASMGYVPTNSPVVPVAAARPEVRSNPYPSRSSLPVKVGPYNNFTTRNGGSASQFSQPIVGHMSNRTQTLRYAGQYPVHTGPAAVHPNSQAVMVGRFGQLVYVHPSSQDIVQGTTVISPLSARPMLTQHQVQFPKHQGIAGQALQLCVPPPSMATGQQPFPIAKSYPIYATSLPF